MSNIGFPKEVHKNVPAEIPIERNPKNDPIHPKREAEPELVPVKV